MPNRMVIITHVEANTIISPMQTALTNNLFLKSPCNWFKHDSDAVKLECSGLSEVMMAPDTRLSNFLCSLVLQASFTFESDTFLMLMLVSIGIISRVSKKLKWLQFRPFALFWKMKMIDIPSESKIILKGWNFELYNQKNKISMIVNMSKQECDENIRNMTRL